MGLYSERDTFHSLALEEPLVDPIREALYLLDPIVRADNRGRTFGLSEVVDDIGWDLSTASIPEVRRLLQALRSIAQQL